MFCGLNAKKKKKITALYLILKIWSQKFGVSSFHFCSVYVSLKLVCNGPYYKDIHQHSSSVRIATLNHYNFLEAMKKTDFGLLLFLGDAADEKKNLPLLICCLHLQSLFPL